MPDLPIEQEEKKDTNIMVTPENCGILTVHFLSMITKQNAKIIELLGNRNG
jgi:hypothetical protein